MLNAIPVSLLPACVIDFGKYRIRLVVAPDVVVQYQCHLSHHLGAILPFVESPVESVLDSLLAEGIRYCEVSGEGRASFVTRLELTHKDLEVLFRQSPCYQWVYVPVVVHLSHCALLYCHREDKRKTDAVTVFKSNISIKVLMMLSLKWI